MKVHLKPFILLALAACTLSCKKENVRSELTGTPTNQPENYAGLKTNWPSTTIPFSSLGVEENGRVNTEPGAVQRIGFTRTGIMYFTGRNNVYKYNGTAVEIYKTPTPPFDGGKHYYEITRPVSDKQHNIYFGVTHVVNYVIIGNNVIYKDCKILKVTPQNEISVLAGSDTNGLKDGNKTTAQFSLIADLFMDQHDNIYVADRKNNVIRKVTLNGDVTTVTGYSDVRSVALDKFDNIYALYYNTNNNDITIGKQTTNGTRSTLMTIETNTDGNPGLLLADKFNNILFNITRHPLAGANKPQIATKLKIINPQGRVFTVSPLQNDCESLAADYQDRFYTINYSATTGSIVRYAIK